MALLDRDRRRLNRAMPINCDIQLGDIIQEMQEKLEGGDGGVEIPDGSITTDKFAIDAKAPSAAKADKVDLAGVNGLQTALDGKIDKPAPLEPSKVIGTTLETNKLGIVNYSQSPFPDSLAMYQFGGQLAVGNPQADSDATTKQYVDSNSAAAKLSAVDPIADPDNAQPADIANKINEILAALKG